MLITNSTTVVDDILTRFHFLHSQSVRTNYCNFLVVAKIPHHCVEIIRAEAQYNFTSNINEQRLEHF